MKEGTTIYSCNCQIEDGEYCAYLVDDPALRGYGGSVKEAVDDLYLELLESGGDPEAVIEVISGAADDEQLYRLGPNEVVSLTGKSDRLYFGKRCEKCRTSGPRNFAELIDLEKKPKAAITFIPRIGIRIYERRVADILINAGVPLIAHEVTINGQSSDYVELEPTSSHPKLVAARARIAGSLSNWKCSACSAVSLFLQDTVTGIGAAYYVVSSVASSMQGGLFIEDLRSPVLILKGFVIDGLKRDGLMKRVVREEVYVVDDAEIIDVKTLQDYPSENR